MTPPPPDAAMAALRERLLQPAGRVGFWALLAHWRQASVMVQAPLPAHFDTGPGLGARLRGALGWALRDIAASASRPGRASAHAVLFGDHGDWRAGLSLPRPYVLAGATDGARLTITLTLFGFATAWLNEARQALLQALAGGIKLSNDTPVRARIYPDAIETTRLERIECPLEPDSEALMVFSTPLEVRRGDGLIVVGPGLLAGLGTRIGGLARWNDMALDDDFTALRTALAALKVDTGAMQPCLWQRFSSSAPGRPIPMHGLTGALRLDGDFSRLWPLLVMGSFCHIGSQSALGLGRYALAPWQAAEVTC
jgi:hypothetical protein